MSNELQLKVGDAKQRDVGRGIARIDQKTMQKLEISAGDVIEIIGKRATKVPLHGQHTAKTKTGA